MNKSGNDTPRKNRRLNCNTGNYQCGGKCQPNNWKCRRRMELQKARLADNWTKLLNLWFGLNNPINKEEEAQRKWGNEGINDKSKNYN